MIWSHPKKQIAGVYANSPNTTFPLPPATVSVISGSRDIGTDSFDEAEGQHFFQQHLHLNVKSKCVHHRRAESLFSRAAGKLEAHVFERLLEESRSSLWNGTLFSDSHQHNKSGDFVCSEF